MTRAPIPALTGLRFVAALSVVLSHALTKLAPYNGPPLAWYQMLQSAAGIGMPLFFVLSGFVIHYNYSQSIQSGQAAGIYRFFVARFARLYPLYAVAVAFELINSWSYYQTPDFLGSAIAFYATMTQSWVYEVLGQHSLIYAIGGLTSVAWSISTEWFFYIAYIPLCFLLVSAPNRRTLLTAAGVLSAVCIGAVLMAACYKPEITAWAGRRFGPVAASEQDSFFRWIVYFAPYTRVSEFILGCLTASLYMRLQNRPVDANDRRTGRILLGAGLIWTVGLYTLIFGLSARYNPHWLQVVGVLHMCYGLAPGLALVIFCCARYPSLFGRMMSTPLVLVCGEASYSLYLWHVVIIEKFGYLQPNISGDWRIAAGCFMRLGFCIAACIGLSIVSWKLIEVPARDALRHLLSPRRNRLRGFAGEQTLDAARKA